MWLLEHPDLPTVQPTPAVGAPFFAAQVTDQTLSPLVEIDFQANQFLPGVNPSGLISSSQIMERTINPDGSVTVASAFEAVSIIAHNGQIFTPAKDPSNLQAGEFSTVAGATTFKPRSGSSVVPDLPIVVTGFGNSGELVSDWVDPAIFESLYGLPVVGEITWTLNAEAHPSGSIELYADGDTISTLRERFKKGTILSFAGVGFAVDSFSDSLEDTQFSPGFCYSVKINLGGKWDTPSARRPSYYRPELMKNPLVNFTLNYCSSPDRTISKSSSPLDSSNRTSVAKLASQVGVPFVGYSPSPLPVDAYLHYIAKADQSAVQGLSTLRQTFPLPQISAIGAWDVVIPQGTQPNGSTSWESEARARLRQNGCFLNLNNPLQVEALDLLTPKRWQYTVRQLTNQNNGNTLNSPDYHGYSVEYIAARLSGEFSEQPELTTQEDTQETRSGQAKWIPVPIREVVLESGDRNADRCPPEYARITSMSMCHSNSGPTQQRIRTKTINGFQVLQETWTYGFQFYRTEVENLTDGGAKDINAPAADFWTLIRYERREPEIDDTTRYLLGSRQTGWQYSQKWKEEDEGKRRDDYDEANPEYDLFTFKKVPIVGIERKRLETFAAFYGQEPTGANTAKQCLPDGTAQEVEDTSNPNYAPPMFEIASRSFSSSFSWAPNPERETSDLSDLEKYPDICEGEETDIYKEVRIHPTIYSQQPRVDNSSQSEAEKQDFYTTYTYKISARGTQFKDQTIERTFEDFEDRPAQAARSPDLFKKQEANEQPVRPTVRVSGTSGLGNVEWVVCTPGYTVSDIPGPSLSFPTARTLDQAIRAAVTDLRFRDAAESVSFSYSIPFNSQIRPLDVADIFAGPDFYQTSVQSISQKVAIQGNKDGYPLCVCQEGTKITAGLWREIPVQIYAKPLPAPQKPPTALSQTAEESVFTKVSYLSLASL